MIFLLFLAGALVITFPLIFKINSFFWGLPGDSLGNIYGNWWQKFALLNHKNSHFLSIINYPYGLDLSHGGFSIFNFIGKLLTFLTNEVIAYNLIIILSFTLAGYFAYLLGKQLFKNELIAVFLGITYAFSPYLQAHSLQHLGLLTDAAFIPLFFYLLIRLFEQLNFENLIYTALTFTVIFTENLYYGYFLSFSLILFIFCRLAYLVLKKNWPILGQTALKFLHLFLLTAALVLIFNFKIISPVLQHQKPQWAQTAKKEVSELSVYKATAADYLLPSIDHPIFGEEVYDFVKKSLNKSNVFEKTLYLGWTLIILALIGLFKSRRNFYLWTFFVLAIFALVFSLSTTLQNASYNLLPYFRVYARLGLLVFLSVAVLAGFGLQWINKNLLTVLAIVLIMSEFATFSPLHLTAVNNVSPVDKWLKEQEDGVAVFYPLVSSEEVRYNQYLFYQRLHQKKMVNGALLKTPQEDERETLINLENQNTINRLKTKGVRYLVVNKEFYREGRLPNVLWRYYDPSYEKYPAEYLNGRVPDLSHLTGIELLKDFDDGTVYQIK